MTQGAGHKPERTASDRNIEALTGSAPASATSILAVDLAALQRNYRKLAGLAAPAECAGVVKADAYGIGIAEAVPALAAAGCRTFFVATLDEARKVAATGLNARVYVLDGLFPGAAPDFQAAGARPVLGSMDEIGEWAAFASQGATPLPAAVHVDTGMNRLGVKPADHMALAAAGGMLQAIPVDLLLSHLACADTPDNPKSAAQRAAFRDVAARLPPLPLSLANSAGVFLGADYAFDLVRPGIALYGGNPFADRPNPMEPVLRLYGRIAQLGEAERGETVGYGAARTLTRRTRYATVAVGYADGYFRALGSADGRDGAVARLGGHTLPILGRVSMDLTVFDITELPEGAARRGGWVELIGERFTIDDAAACAGTIPYEVLTSLGRRYHRIYTGLETGQEPG